MVSPTISFGTRTFATLLFLLGLAIPLLNAQETVFNVPSADVLDKGQNYFEWDGTIGDSTPSAAITPRQVRGIGHNIEVGFNLTSLNLPTNGSVIIVPTIKWKFYQYKRLALDFFGGEHIFLPVTKRTYNVGSFSYLTSAKTFKKGTRLAAGLYDFSAHVVDHANYGGIFASIEQPITPRLSAATDWYSGHNDVGYVTSGFSLKATSTVTIFTAFQMGNHDFSQGNHSVLLVLGWNPQWKRTTL